MLKAATLPALRGPSRRRSLWLPTALAHAVPLAALFETSVVSASPTSRASQASMAFVSAASVSAQTVELTLADAVFLGLRDNRNLRSAYLQRIVHKFDLRVAEDAFTPRLTITSKHQANRTHADQDRDHNLTPKVDLKNEWGTTFSLSWTQHFNRANEGGNKRDNSLAFEIKQPLLRGAGRDITTAPVRQARLSEAHQQLQLKASVSQTVTQIVSAYRGLLQAQEQQRIAEAALARSRKLLEVNNALIAAGRMAQFERVQTEADLAGQELNVEETANRLDASRKALLLLLALDLGTQLKASDTLKAERLEIDRQQALQLALAQQPVYLQKLIEGEQTDIRLRLAEDERLWDLSLVGGADQARQSASAKGDAHAGRSWRSYAGLELTIPIGDLSARQRVAGAQVAVQDHIIQLAEARQVLEQQVGDGIRDMGTRWRQYEIAQRLRELSQRKLEIERDKLQLGRSSNFQVLSFETDLRQAENSMLDAQIAYLNAQTQLDERLGMTLQSWEIALND
ncbi:MAG: Outer rane efflux family protein [Pseudomonas sp.]|nr:Outer rane efflux family protein [Pseudomonas sp.]